MSFRALQAEIMRALGKIDTRQKPAANSPGSWPQQYPFPVAQARHAKRVQKAGHPRDEPRKPRTSFSRPACRCSSSLAGKHFMPVRNSKRSVRRQAQMHARRRLGAQTTGARRAIPQPATGSGVPAQGGEPEPKKTRAEALAESPRVKLDAPAIYGSIALKGARLDDVSFKALSGNRRSKQPGHHLALAGQFAHALLRRGGLHRRSERNSCSARDRIRSGRPIMIR